MSLLTWTLALVVAQAPDGALGAAPVTGATVVGVQSLVPQSGAPPARIGQPLEWRIHVALASGDGVDPASTSAPAPAPAPALALALARGDDERAREAELEALGWVVLDGPRYPDAATRAWTVMALDPGARTTLDLDVGLADGRLVHAPAATIEVLGDLQEGEDAPRPARGFRTVPDGTVVQPKALALGALSVVLLGVGGLLLAKRRRAGDDRAPRPPSARERLAALDATGDPLTLVGALGPLLRAAVDDARGVERSALTDDEWRAALASDGGVERGLGARIDAVVARSAEARYSGRAPSVLGLRELLDEARALAVAPLAGDAPRADLHGAATPRARARDAGAQGEGGDAS